MLLKRKGPSSLTSFLICLSLNLKTDILLRCYSNIHSSQYWLTPVIMFRRMIHSIVLLCQGIMKGRLPFFFIIHSHPPPLTPIEPYSEPSLIRRAPMFVVILPLCLILESCYATAAKTFFSESRYGLFSSFNDVPCFTRNWFVC